MDKPCNEIMAAAAKYYNKPVKDLKLKKPLEELYRDAKTDEPIGQWVESVPRPGDVAACVGKPKEKRTIYLCGL